MRYVEPDIPRERVLKVAQKHRRTRSYLGTARAIHGGDPGIGAAFGALFLMFFPVTYPAHRLLNLPQDLVWLRLALWPFYEFTIGFSTSRGLKKTTLWVEATDRGLMLGSDSRWRGGWGEGYYLSGWREPTEEPLTVEPKDSLGVTKLSDGDPAYEDIVYVPPTLSSQEAAEFLETGVEAIIQDGVYSWASEKFVESARLLELDASAMSVKGGESINYPFWVAKYRKRDITRYLVFTSVRASRVDQVDISEAVFHNDTLSDILSTD